MTRRELMQAALAAAAGMITSPLLHAAPSTTQPAMMRWADRSRGRPYSKDPSVVRFRDRYLMYFSIPPRGNGDERWGQAVAESTDLVDWKTVGELTPVGDHESRGLCAGDAIVLNDRVHLFYQTYGNAKRDTICHAISEDGVKFERPHENPIFRPTGDWTCGRAIDAFPHVVGDELFCYWATRDPDYKIQMIGVHSAPLSSDFSPKHWRQRCDASILKPKLPWERDCIEAPTVTTRPDGTHVMFYAGAYNNAPQQIGVAFSKDGLNWTRMSDKPFLANGAPGEWNHSESGHPGIFVDPIGGTTWLFFQGNDDKGKSWWLSKRRIEWDATHVPRLA